MLTLIAEKENKTGEGERFSCKAAKSENKENSYFIERNNKAITIFL